MTILAPRTVLVIETDLDAFKASWPCSHIPDGVMVAFEFAANGDLVDIKWFDCETGLDIAEPESVDGFALEALSKDAGEYLKSISEIYNLARRAKFALGRLVATPGAMAAMIGSGDNPADYLARHLSGDWGELSPHDVAENEYAVSRELRIFSSYRLTDGTTIWVITEADRSSTTILLPEEY
jgi:hypothetical protein